MSSREGAFISAGVSNDDGGGILNAGRLTLQDNAVVYWNRAYAGGGIDNGGTVRVYGYQNGVNGGASKPVLIEWNYAAWDGGGINNGGTVLLENADVWSNTAGANGGGIMNDAGAGLYVYYSTFEHNDAYGNGGSIDNAGYAYVTGSAFEHDWAGNSGGGIFSTPTLYVYSSAFEYEQAAFVGGGIENWGGSVHWGSLTFYVNTAAIAPNFFVYPWYYF